MNIKWIVQTNLSKNYSSEVAKACKTLGLEFQAENAIPFSDAIPNAPTNQLTTFYGATNWINNIYEKGKWVPGIFFNPASTFDNWIFKYGEDALNFGAKITTINKLAAMIKLGSFTDEQFFIRPLSDQKEFAGDVITAKSLSQWAHNLMTNAPDVGDIKVAVSKPYGISNEWRLFIVDGVVISGSHYRSYHRLDIKDDVPKEVIEFAEKQINKYAPSPVFVMDIGKSADQLYVIEIGCFHSAGFYAADVTKIVDAVSQYIIKNYNIKDNKTIG